jgi:hypothetical protein
MTNEEFINKAKTIYKDRFTYNNCKYTSYKNKVVITCKEHGDFSIRADHFLAGHSCPFCSKPVYNTETFIEKAQKIHGNKYDYSKVEYKKSSEKVCIICPIHGEFWQTPNSHLNGRGCPKCKAEKTRERCNMGKESFIEKAREKHGDKYDYSKVEYKDNKTKVCIICPIHGEFWQTPTHHLSGEGCPKCKYSTIAQQQQMGNEEFIKKSREKHGDKYDYSLVNYINYETYVNIICPIHGVFKQSPDCHLHSGGCPKCGATLSKNEEELLNYIRSLIGEDNVIERDRKILKNKEIDILIPSMHLGIEYDGLYWHSERNSRINKFYHLQKTIEAEKEGITLIHIFEDEYVKHKEIVKSKIRHFLKCDNLPHIGARKCYVKEIEASVARDFLNEYHIQGFSKSSIYLGCFYKDELIGVMSFVRSRKDSNDWELNRFATNYNYICQGVGSKLFKYFVTCKNPSNVKSFLDRRWCFDKEKNIYTILGFYKEYELNPDYRYYNERINPYERIHKFNFRKKTLNKKYGLPILETESNMAKELNYAKIWDCGLIKYVWKSPKK